MVSKKVIAGIIVAVVVIIIVVVAALGLFVPQPSPQPAKRPLKIACFEPFTGMPLAARNSMDGYRFALEDWGKDNVAGHPIQIFYIDTELKPEVAFKKAREIIAKEDVDFLVGEEASSIEIKLGAVGKEFGKFVVIGNAVAETYTTKYYKDIYPYTVITGGFSTNPVKGMAKFLAEIAPRDAAVGHIGPNYEWGWACWDLFKQEITKLRPDIKLPDPADEQWPKLGERVYEPYISALMKKEYYAVFTSFWGDDAVAFIKQAKAMGLAERTILMMSTMSSDELAVLGRDFAVANMIFGGFGGYWWEYTPMLDYGRRFLSKYGYWPGYSSTTAYTGLMFIFQLVEKAGGIEPYDPAKLLDIAKKETFSMLGVTVRVRPEDHQLTFPYVVGLTKVIDEPPYHRLDPMRVYSCDEVSHSAEVLAKLRGS